jgi:hypothetical protein
VYNYKLGLAMPLVLGWTLFQLPKANRWRLGVGCVGGILVPFVSLWIVFVAVNPLALALRPLSTYLGLLARDANPSAISQGLDPFFYVYYVHDWENVALWLVGGAGLAIAMRNGEMRKHAVFALVWIAVGVLLPKAPRWLFPVLPLMDGFPLQALQVIPKVWMRAVLGILMLGYGFAHLHLTEALPKWTSCADPFGLVVPVADKHKASSRAFTHPESLGDSIFTLNSTLPYLLSHGVKVHILRLPEDSGYAFPTGAVVWTDYTTSLINASDLGWDGKLITPLVEGCQVVVSSPVVWLEHAEYTGRTYRQTITAWAAKKDGGSSSVRIYQIGKRAKP